MTNLTRCRAFLNVIPIVLIALCVTLRVADASQQPPAGNRRPPLPPRDPSAVSATSTGRIRGIVTSLDSGSVLRGARVRLTMQPGVGERESRTDEQGVFEFDRLAPGAYRLTAGRAGYVVRIYGQRGSVGPGQPINLAAGQSILDIAIALPRATAIVGNIVDEYGDPIADVTVQALREQYFDGLREATPVQRTARTDDLGAYRLFGLQPGNYYLSATVAQGGGPGPGGAVTAAIRALEARGGQSVTHSASPEGAAADSTGYTPAYYPGTPNISSAAMVTVTEGQDTTGVSFALALGLNTTISGRVVNASGEPLLIGNVSLRPSAETGLPRVQTAPISAGGFTLRNVPPGRYVLQAQGVPNTMGSLKGQPANESGRIDISVDGLAQSDVVVTTSKGATLRGRVVRDGDTQQPLGTIGVVAMSTVQRTAGPGVVTEVAADGTFELRGVHDASVFRIANSTNGWDLKTVLLRGTDVTDKPTQLGPDEVIEGVEVHLSNRLPRLSITLTSRPSGRDAGGGVIVFSTDSSRWGARSRFVKTVQLDETGAGEVGGLVPGQYFVAMVDYDDTPAATDPKFLERMKAQAMTVSLRDGETKQVSLSTRSAR